MTILKDATTGRPGGRDKGLIRGNVRSGVRSDMSPPVVRRRRALHDPTSCERCGAVYSHQTWRTGERAARADPVGAFWTVCPACEQFGAGEFFGRVIIRGAYAEANATAIRDRIRGVAARARHGVEEVSIVTSLPGGIVRAAKQEQRVTDAIRAAFLALTRELERVHGERRRFIEPPGPRLRGRIRGALVVGADGRARRGGEP